MKLRRTKLLLKTGVGTTSPTPKPEKFGGVGAGLSTSSTYGRVYGCLENGFVLPYRAQIIDHETIGDSQYRTPALLGMPELRRMNAYIGCGRDQLHLVPKVLEDQIIWPAGTMHWNCEQSPGGHMMLVMSHWNRFRGKEKTVKLCREHLDLAEKAKL